MLVEWPQLPMIPLLPSRKTALPCKYECHLYPHLRIFERDPACPLPEMKVIKPSDTRWLAHKLCIKAVKVSCIALVVTLDSNYQNFHFPEALGLYKAQSKFTTIAAIYLLDYTLPLVAKLSKNKSYKPTSYIGLIFDV